MGARTNGHGALRLTLPVLLVCAMGVALTLAVPVHAAGAVVQESLIGRVIDAGTLTFEAVAIEGVASGPGDTIYVAGRWRRDDGQPDFIGVMALGPGGEYRLRLGDWFKPATPASRTTMSVVTGVAYDPVLDAVWVSGVWGLGSGAFSGGASFRPNGDCLGRVTGMHPQYYPGRAVQDIAVDAAGTVYLAGDWTYNGGAPHMQGVAAVSPSNYMRAWLGTIDIIEEDGTELILGVAQASGVGASPSGSIYVGGTWVDPSGAPWTGAMDFTPYGQWRGIVAQSLADEGLDATSVFDVHADTRANALVAAAWSDGGPAIYSVGRFGTTGAYVDRFGETIDIDGAPGAAQAISAASSDRNLSPEFEPLGDQSIVALHELNLVVSAADVFRYYVAGRWVVDGGVAADGVAAFAEYGDPADLAYSASGLPSGATFDAATRTLSWVPGAEQVGTYVITLTASDGVRHTDRAVTLEVVPNSVPGAGSGSTTFSAQEEIAAGFTLPGEDADGDALTFAVVSGPAHGSLTGDAPDLTYTGDVDFFGTDTITYTVSDGFDVSDPIEATIVVENVDDPPVVRADLATLAVNEGETARVTGTWFDPDPETVIIAPTPYGEATVNSDGTWSWEWVATDGPEASADITFCYWDECGEDIFETGMRISVEPLPPVITSITCPIEPIPVGTPVSVTGTFVDPGIQCPHSGCVEWGAAGTTPLAIEESAGTGSFSASYAFTTPGVYPVSLMCGDDDGECVTQLVGHVVIYDPNGGFVTGGGWIQSPAGAYTPELTTDADVTGRAHFAFESAYRKGATTPSGHTAFRFQAADLVFTSESYQWLVVAGNRAQYKGVGTVAGFGPCGFMLTANDGGTQGTDCFRIKIWQIESGDIVYDNQYGESDGAAPTTAIAGGSIIVRTR